MCVLLEFYVAFRCLFSITLLARIFSSQLKFYYFFSRSCAHIANLCCVRDAHVALPAKSRVFSTSRETERDATRQTLLAPVKRAIARIRRVPSANQVHVLLIQAVTRFEVIIFAELLSASALQSSNALHPTARRTTARTLCHIFRHLFSQLESYRTVLNAV